MIKHTAYHSHKATLTTCSCGKLYFTYGPITVQLDPDQFLAFASSVAMLESQFQQTVNMPNFSGTSHPNGDLCH
jgi:hypothetical protein